MTTAEIFAAIGFVWFVALVTGWAIVHGAKKADLMTQRRCTECWRVGHQMDGCACVYPENHPSRREYEDE